MGLLKGLGVFVAARQILEKPGMRVLYTAGAVRYMGGYAILAFVPEFYRRTFPASAAAFSTVNALIISVGGMTSILASGYVTDKVRPCGTLGLVGESVGELNSRVTRS
eukprot:1153746-Prorocentrum_minimum.AAC.1